MPLLVLATYDLGLYFDITNFLSILYVFFKVSLQIWTQIKNKIIC